MKIISRKEVVTISAEVDHTLTNDEMIDRLRPTPDKNWDVDGCKIFFNEFIYVTYSREVLL